MFRLSQVAWLAVAIACGNDGIEPCPVDYSELPDLTSCYRALPTEVNWVEARAACDAEGSILAIPSSGYEALAIATVMNNAGFTNAWVGINDIDAEDQFVNVLDEPQTFLPWNELSGEPDGGTTENCVRINSDGKLVDVECTDLEIPACEFLR